MALTDQQLTTLLEHCTEFARQMIEKAGEFYPFGAEIDREGQLKALGFADGSERPAPQDLYSYAQKVLSQRARAGEILGAAIAANVNIPAQFSAPYPDGIRVHVESDGFSRYIYTPYKIEKAGFLSRKRSVIYADMFGVDLPQIIFSKNE